MKKLFFILVVLSCQLAFSQDETVTDLKKASEKGIAKDPKDTIPKLWKKGGSYGLNVGQSSLSNWAAGGEAFSLSVNSVLNLFAFYKKGRHNWDNVLDFNLGYVRTTSLGSRKNDDRIDLLSKYGYALRPKLNMAALFNFRSQLFKGYSYDAEGLKTFTSTFLSPGYILFSPGLDWKPTTSLSVFVSPIAARLTLVLDDTLSAKGLYGVDPGEKSNTEAGAFASINFMKDFSESIGFKSRLDLFSNYENNPQNIDLYFTNALNVKLSKILTLTWSVDMIYDDDVRIFGPDKNSAATQFKSMAGLGLLAKF